MPDEPAVTRDQVVSIYRQIIGRTPREEEIEFQVEAAPNLDAVLRSALDSEEYKIVSRAAGRKVSPSTTVVNTFHPDLAAWGLHPGTRSTDGEVIVGHDGWVFLSGGTNFNLAQYLGEVQMPPNWLDDWREVFAARDAELATFDLDSAFLVVPDKLAVYPEHYPEHLNRLGPRPVERLLGEGGLDIVYPVDELRAAAQEDAVFLRTDSHLTFRGNQVLFEAVAARLGVAELPDLGSLPMRSYPVNGDLGEEFEPQIIGIVTEPGSLGRARIVEDNEYEIKEVGGHIGTRRVFHNNSAPDERTAVIFGDSFGNGLAHYQGVSWFMAQAFREVHYVWVPFGWDPDYVRRTGADAVLIEGAERFLARVPQPSVDADRVTAETLQRRK